MRKFHALQPDYTFITHVRNDIPDETKEKRNIGQVHESLRGATVALVLTGDKIAHGIARCEYKYQFNRKLARSCAIGRAKQAAVDGPSKGWWIHGVQETKIHNPNKDPKVLHKALKDYAVALLDKLYYRAEVYPSKN